MYRHILIPLENAESDRAILSHIRPLAKLTGARLTLIHVADGFMARNQKPPLNLDESEEMRRDRAYLDEKQTELSRDGFAVDAVLACGDPTRQILDTAQSLSCDLIAMSTHGHRWLGDLIFGSVAESVRHRTEIPVLLVRAT
jgi:nucleotide-binding universal stress UspA family protein